MSTLSQFISGSPSVLLGQSVMLPDIQDNLVQKGDMTFLRSGYFAVGDEALYPEAYAEFPRKILDESLWTATSTGSTNLRSLAYGNGLWVAVGYSGLIVTSPDTVTWTVRHTDLGGATPFTCVKYLNGRWFAGGSGKIATSIDGISWTSQATTPAHEVTDIAYGNGVYVAVGYTGASPTVTRYASVSSDGTSWSTSTIGNSANPGDGVIIYSETHGKFFTTTVTYIYTSENGTNWTLNSSGSYYQGITEGQGKIVVRNGNTDFSISRDGGKSWASVTAPSGVAATKNLIYANGMFVCNGGVSSSFYLLVSYDGITWFTLKYLSAASVVHGLAYGDGVLATMSSTGNDVLKTQMLTAIGSPTTYAEGNATQYMRIK